ncbi:MAG: 50S ribosomal protein L11 methyltransferase [Archangiaceae bacterium]|nr:50S ribosomal protein L11 methyltransferase [Archangiaceae bacterium]
MAWFSLTADVKHEELERTESILHDCEPSGLEVRDGPGGMPGIRAPASGEAIVVAYFDGKVAASKAEKELKKSNPAARTTIEKVEDKDWSTEWKTRIKNVTVGRLWVGPPWDVEKAAPHLMRLVIEPKMAFGTGDHPTTSLCLAAVDMFMAAHAGASVLDIGTGTGVLAFAAAKLGASRVVATDNDPVAVALAKEAARENDIDGVEISTKSLKQVSGTFDLVVANILANTLIELAPLIVPKVGKRLVLAGILAPQAESVSGTFVKRGLTALEPTAQGEWVRLDFERR